MLCGHRQCMKAKGQLCVCENKASGKWSLHTKHTIKTFEPDAAAASSRRRTASSARRRGRIQIFGGPKCAQNDSDRQVCQRVLPHQRKSFVASNFHLTRIPFASYGSSGLTATKYSREPLVERPATLRSVERGNRTLRAGEMATTRTDEGPYARPKDIK